MSNFSGNVDVVREREAERQARLQLLDGGREPSPQPIFGEPIRVDPSLEDATTRRIKDTLGDFTQVQHVLINDPKHLIGISRSLPAIVRDDQRDGIWGSTARQQHSSVRSGQAPRDSSASKKLLLINGTHKPYASSSARVDAGKTSHAPVAKPSSERKAPVKHRIENLKNAFHGVCGTSIHVEKDKPREKSKDSNRTREREHSSYSVPSSNPVTVNNCSNVTVNVANVSIASDAFNSCSNPLSLIVHNGSHPNGLIRDGDCDISNKRNQPKHSLTKLSIPVQKTVESHIELKSIFQEMKEAVPPPLTAIHTPKNDGSGFSFPLENSVAPFDKRDEQSPLCQTPPPAKKTTVASTTVNLQEDLEMSDSDDDDDEPAALKISPTPVDFLKSPSKTTMDKAASPGGQSSSSGSSCSSDSEESSSSGSDSSASSEASDHETPSTPAPQMWGLSNFFDETRRNHSPAFMNLDNNTNSSTAVKEEPVLSVASLADEDSVNCILGKYPLQSPPIADFLDLHDAGGDDAKSEILSPIHSLSPPSCHPSLKGPRTPPSPPEPQEEVVKESVISKKDKIKQDVQKVSQTKSESKSASEPIKAAATTDVQNVKVKTRVGKSKTSSHSRTSEAGEISRTDSKEHNSASKNSTKVSAVVAKPSAVSAITVTSATTCPVPSITTATSRGSPIKPHHKHSSSSVKRTKSYNELGSSSVKKEPKKSHTFPKPSPAKTVPPPKFSEPSSVEVKRSSSSVKSESSVQGDGASKLEKNTQMKKSDSSSSLAKKSKDSHARQSSSHESKSNTTPKVKQKSEKAKTQSEPVVKKPDKKKKPVKKFCIKDFVQSPVPPPPPFSEDEVSVNSPFQKSPTPERIPSPVISREENDEQKLSPVSLPSSKTQSSEKQSSKIGEKHKHTRKRSHSSVIDVINRVARGEIFDRTREETRPSIEISEELTSIISDKSSDSHHLPVHVVAPQLLSPISVDSPVPSNKSESAISSVVVSIPLEMLLRVPHMKSKHKTSSQSEEKTVPVPVKEKVPPAEKPSNQPPADKPLLSDDIKSKYRTDASEVRTSKETPKKEKSSKESKHSQGSSSSSVNKSSSNSSSKSSSKVVSNSSENVSTPIPKKRKLEGDDNSQLKKKPKVPLKPAHTIKKEPKEPSPVVKIEPVSPLPAEPKRSPKPLERVGSASSLSSFSSQQSHKSIKGAKEKLKDRIKDEPESKRLKNSSSSAAHVKEVKREKDEKPKIREKKECLLSEKTRTSKESIIGKESEKVYKSEPAWDSKENVSAKDKLYKTEPVWDEFHNLSSQSGHWDVQCKSEESKMCKSEESKMMPTNHERQSATESHKRYASTFDWQNFTPGAERTPRRSNKQRSDDEYYMEEAREMKHQADKQPDAVLQAMQYLEAVLLFILTAHHKEKNNRDAESIFRLYKETLHFSYYTIQKLQNSCPTFGSTEYKLLILTLRCQSLLSLKLYYLRKHEVKEHQKGVNDFMKQSTSYRLSSHSSPLPANNSSFSRNMSQPSPCQPRLGAAGGVPSPHSPTPSPAGSVNSQSSGYSSSEMNSYHSRPQSSLQSAYAPAVVSVPQNVFDMMKRQHTHLNNLHNCHELWEQADMYMTRHSKEFFKEIAEKSHQLTLHSSIDDLVNYVQKGLSMLKAVSQ